MRARAAIALGAVCDVTRAGREVLGKVAAGFRPHLAHAALLTTLETGVLNLVYTPAEFGRQRRLRDARANVPREQ